jgi:hypothetical protein
MKWVLIRRLWRLEDQTPTADPCVWKMFFFSANYTVGVKCEEGCHHAEKIKEYILQ